MIAFACPFLIICMASIPALSKEMREFIGLWCKALIRDNVIDNEVMGWSNLLWKRNWIYLNGSNMNRQSFY
ncbi:hypothetical protein BC351_39140 [Paenibacillus ferrarius]|uniref:Uncharacterized protein n=1 Tax=Paenibacillus ferrarius TaxID=1469647 RepID=A0A1V4H9K0_9BACL|nr:hypothetical protein BC351_39140 [Paenibacillus ferrarius]